MAINYFGPVRLTLGFLPVMHERRSGQIVNVSTMGVQCPTPRFAAYLASKSALDTFTQVLAAEQHRYGIACTSVHMPLVRTPMIAPTDAYERAPALSASQGADLVCEEIRSRRAVVDLPFGVITEVATALVPGVMTRLSGLTYRVAGDSAAAKGELE
jgi:short-subunit dehydrogenase